MAMTSLESQKLFQKFRISMQVHQYLILASPHAMRDVFSVCKYIYLPDIKLRTMYGVLLSKFFFFLAW